MQDNQPGLRPSQEIQKAIQNHGWAGTLEMQTRPGKEEMSWNWNPEQMEKPYVRLMQVIQADLWAQGHNSQSPPWVQRLHITQFLSGSGVYLSFEYIVASYTWLRIPKMTYRLENV